MKKTNDYQGLHLSRSRHLKSFSNIRLAQMRPEIGTQFQ